MGYYVYLLDYGWHEPLGEALRTNFERMADVASRNNAVVMQGTPGSHFEDEVLSWHHINGTPADALLPAILITDRHPNAFQEQTWRRAARNQTTPYPLLLIPLKEHCQSTSEVAALIHKVFRDIGEKKTLPEFEVAAEQRRGIRGAVTDALILQPNFAGVGVDLKRLAQLFKREPES